MNKKLLKYLDDGDRMEKKIQELQEQLQAVRSAQELEENREILKSFRGMKLGGRELFDLLCGLQDGSVTLKKSDLPSEGEEERQKTSGKRKRADGKTGSEEQDTQENETEEREEEKYENEMSENA